MTFVVSLCFFLSGLSGLCFEVVWSKQLSHVLGTSSLAISSVVTSYMAGLAFGSYLAGRFEKKISRALVGYALCEAGVALFGLLLPSLLSLYPGLYRALWGSFYGQSFYLFSVLRFLLVFVTLLVPTTLMGATLPLLVRFFSERLQKEDDHGLGVGTLTARLYTINLAGACAGVVLAGFWLLPSIGIRATTYFAASINLLLPLLLWVSARALRREPLDEDVTSLLRAEEESLASRQSVGSLALPLGAGARRWVRIAFGLSGLLSMAYQMFWTRALAIILGASVYAFSLILACFLLGLLLGGLFGSWALKWLRRPLMALSFSHFGVALSSYLTSLFLDRLPRFWVSLSSLSPGDLWQSAVSGIVICALVVLLPAFFIGTIFPFSVRLVSLSKEGAAKEVANAYAANTIGAIVGSFAGGFLLMPLFGLEHSLYGGVLFSAILGALLWLLLRPEEASSGLRLSVPVVMLVLFSLLVFGAPRWNIVRLNEGLFRPSIAQGLIEEGDFSPPEAILYYRDGITTTVSLEDLGDDHLALKVNGKVDASSSSDMITQILAGAIPLALHPESNQRTLDTAIIGFGSGVTIGSSLQFDTNVDVIEIESAVVEAATYFARFNHNVHQDQRLSLFYDDGRNFLQSTPEQYDVIISEPSNPWLAGVANLFTREFFQDVQKRLRPNGVFLQWLQLYELSPQTIQLVMRTFQEAFPEGIVFCAGPYSPDLLLIGTPPNFSLSPENLSRVLSSPKVAAEFSRANVSDAFDLMSLFLFGGEDIKAWVGDGEINTDDNGALEFAAPRDLLLSASSEGSISRFYDELFEAAEENPGIDPWVSLGKTPEEKQQNAAKLSESLARIGRLRAALRFADQADGLEPGRSTLKNPLGPPRPGPFIGGTWHRESSWARVLVTFLYYRSQEPVPLPESIAPKELFQSLQKLVWRAQKQNSLSTTEDDLISLQLPWWDAYQLIEDSKDKLKAGSDTEMVKGILAYKVGRWNSAARSLQAAISQDPTIRRRYPQVSYYLAKTEFARGQYHAMQRELAWYLAISESDFARPLRRLLEPQP